jgi:murein DD-endopeptidase MepM/ murein hydrolase activator NlpD
MATQAGVMPSSSAPLRALLTAALLALLLVPLQASSALAGARTDAPPPRTAQLATGWTWPLTPVRLERPFEAPAHRYGPGHRGIDLRAEVGDPVRAPAAGSVAFSGAVAGRGVLTIDHGDGLVTTFEPVRSPLAAGASVDRGEEVATLAVGGHALPGSLHFGVRLDGEYINPLLLLGGVPRAVLLPCC